jgi:hypothetical protein
MVGGRGRRRDQFGLARKHSYATMDSSQMAAGDTLHAMTLR